jgi:hypothetical protein
VLGGDVTDVLLLDVAARRETLGSLSQAYRTECTIRQRAKYFHSSDSGRKSDTLSQGERDGPRQPPSDVATLTVFLRRRVASRDQ